MDSRAAKLPVGQQNLNREMFLLERTTVFPGCGQMSLDVQVLNCQIFPLERPACSPPLCAGDHLEFLPCALSAFEASECGLSQVPLQQAMD